MILRRRTGFTHRKRACQRQVKACSFEELKSREDGMERLKALAASGRVTIVYGSKEEKFNNAVALKEFLEDVMSR